MDSITQPPTRVGNLTQNDRNITLATLANINELVGSIAHEVLGNDVADTINGALITRETIAALTQTVLMRRLKLYRD